MACHELRLALSGLAIVACVGCVDAFDGSNLQIDFATAVQTATRPGHTPARFQPPEDTHYELYAVDQELRVDPDGNPILDGDQQPILDQTYLFAVTRFEIRPVIDRSSPCFIELADTQFPGLHVTQFEAQVKEVTGVSDPFAMGVDPDKATDVLDAIRRNDNLESLEATLKAVTSEDPYRYEPTAPAGQCPSTSDLIPDPGCRDPASNKQRLDRCKAIWADHTDLYEGSDKVFTLPLNGSYLGMVNGTNPLNGGRVGGSSMFVDVNLVDHDAYVINWQYDDNKGAGKDNNSDGIPDFPADLDPAEQSPVGYLYMVGTPRTISRDVITVPLRHPNEPAIKADLAIVPNLGHDDVHF